MNDFESIDDHSSTPRSLPNATAVLVLGILSIVTCWLYGIIGIILGIIALVLHKTDKKLYDSNRAAYQQSYTNSNAGKICAIIGLSLSALMFLYLIFILVLISTGSHYPNYWRY